MATGRRAVTFSTALLVLISGFLSITGGRALGDARVPIGDIAATSQAPGYWLLDESGGIFTFEGAEFHGSVPALREAGVPIGPARTISMVPTPGGHGYWVFDEFGGIFAFGDATFHGSVPALRNAGHRIGFARIVDVATTPSGLGYWLLDETGGIFAFGDASFHGSVPALREAGLQIGSSRAVGIVPTGTGGGYWIFDETGGVFTFGDATFKGSVPALRAAGIDIGHVPIVDALATRSGEGYWLLDETGGVFTFGDAGFFGSLASVGLHGRAVGLAPDGDGYRVATGAGHVVSFAPSGEVVVRDPASDPPWADTRPPIAPRASRLKGDANTATAEPRLVNDPNVLWMGTFDNDPWDANFGIAGWGKYKANLSVVSPPFASNGKVMRVYTPGCENEPGVFDPIECRRGIHFNSVFNRMGFSGQEAAYLRYSVYFPASFDFVEGGKLPGLAGTTNLDQPMVVNGDGTYNPDNWTGLIMWDDGGTLVSYLDVKHAAGKDIENNVAPNGHIYGISPKWRVGADPSNPLVKFQPGWNTIELYYGMNTPGQNDGIHRGWLNGGLAVELTDVQYRTGDFPTLDVNLLLTSSFYGGPYGPTTPQYWYLDDFAIFGAA